MSSNRPQWQLQFPPSKIRYWADRYDYGIDDKIAINIGKKVRKRGFLEKQELIDLCHWKSPRIRPKCTSNDAEFVIECTQLALSAAHDKLRIGCLIELCGVGFPMASVILHFCHFDPYPIIDYRALWSLGVRQPSYISYDFWWHYAAHCRGLSRRYRVNMRTLDRALWQYSKENQ